MNGKRARKKKESKKIRYFFYSILFLLIAILVTIEILYNYNMISIEIATADSSIALSLVFAFIVFSYMLAKGWRLKEIILQLGLSKKSLTIKYIGLGILLFLLFLFIEFGTAVFSSVTGIQLPTNVEATFAGLPLYFYFYAFLVAPISEEILFRGFLVPRIGIIGSSLIFGALHYISYFSIIEFLASFAFGMVSAYIFKRTRSLYPSITGHIMINFLGIVATFFA